MTTPIVYSFSLHSSLYMDSAQIELATVIIHGVSLFGFATNIVAVITILKSINLHTPFGILCASLAANNSFVLVLNSAWYMLPDTGIFAIGSMLSRVAGALALALYVVGVRFHVLTSLNRLFAIAFPFISKKYATRKSTTMAVCITLMLSLLQCAPLVIVDGLWFCYNRETMTWMYSKNDAGQFYELYFIHLPVTFDFCCVLVLDVTTIICLRLARSNAVQSDADATKKAVEIRLFEQAFSQSVPLLLIFVAFAYVTPHVRDDFTMFITTTVGWHFAHGIDGLIIDIYHTRLDLFKKRKETISTFSMSQTPTFVI